MAGRENGERLVCATKEAVPPDRHNVSLLPCVQYCSCYGEMPLRALRRGGKAWECLSSGRQEEQRSVSEGVLFGACFPLVCVLQGGFVCA